MSLLPALAPWQQRAYAQACAALDAGHFGHATLVVGPSLLGKRVLAERLAQRVLCMSPRADGGVVTPHDVRTMPSLFRSASQRFP